MNTSVKPSNYPFYFIGAGKITAHDWGDARTSIKFLQEPTSEEKQKIIDNMPAAIKNSIGDGFISPQRDKTVFYLWCKDKIFEDSNWDVEKNANFDKALEEWLLQIHKFCPIEIVARESVEGDFSPWHIESIKSGNELLTKWKTDCGAGMYLATEDLQGISSELIEAMKNKKIKVIYKNYEAVFADSVKPEEIPDEDYHAMDFSVLRNRTVYGSRVLVPYITKGLVSVLNEYRKLTEKGKASDKNISIKMIPEKGMMTFYYGIKQYSGQPFFEYFIGDALTKCSEILELLQSKYDSTFNYIGIWYDEAVAGVPEASYKDLDVAIWSPVAKKRKTPMIGKA